MVREILGVAMGILGMIILVLGMAFIAFLMVIFPIYVRVYPLIFSSKRGYCPHCKHRLKYVDDNKYGCTKCNKFITVYCNVMKGNKD